MSATINFVQRMWALEITRFLFVGGINTLAGIVLYNVLVFFMPYSAAITIQYPIGVVLSYVLNTRIVFHAELRWRKLFQYPIVYIVQYLASLVIVAVLVELFSINQRVAFLVAIAITVPLTFGLSRFIIKEKPVDQGEARSR